MAEQVVRWVYPAQRTTTSKEAEKPYLLKGQSHALIGFDGQVQGGLRPFPGFRKVHEFDRYRAVAPFNGYEHNRVIEAYTVNFLVPDDGYGVAVIYRVALASASDSEATRTRGQIFIDVWNSVTRKWVLGYSLGLTSQEAEDLAVGSLDIRMNPRRVEGLTDSNLGRVFSKADGRTMSVTSIGQFVMIFLQNHSPVIFHVDNTGTLQVVTSPGPGKRPLIVSPEKADGMGALRTTGSATRDGKAQVHLLEYYPSEVGLGLTQPDADVASLLPGGYSFAFRLRDSATGRITGLSEVATSFYQDFDPLYYGGSSSGTGSGYVGGTGVASGTAVQSLLAAIEICYNPDKYDQAYIYRSVRVEGAGGTFTSKLLFLESIIDLADYATVNSPLSAEGGSARAQSVYYFELEDKALVQKELYRDREIFDEEIPYGGAAQAYEGCLVVSNLRTSPAPSSDENTVFDPNLGVGEIRWSSLYEFSPELFPVYNRFVPSLPSDDVISFSLAGPHCIGYSATRQYVVRRESSTIRIEPIHEGYGLVNYMGADTVGSMVYAITSKGLKTTSADGQLDDVRFLNDLIINKWRGDEAAFSLAFDPTASALYVYNSEQEHAAILWFNTSKITELVDLPFESVGRGVWFSSFEYDRDELHGTGSGFGNTTYSNALEERALFLYNPVLNGTQTLDSTDYPALYIADYDRTRNQGDGSGWGSAYAETTLMELGSDAIFRVVTHSTGAKTVSITPGRVVPDHTSGCYMYVLKSDTVPPGTKGKISRTGSTTYVNLTADGNTALTVGGTGLQAGDIVAISPVYQEWTAWPLAAEASDGSQFAAADDFFFLRHASALGTFFTDVSGTSAEETGNYANVAAYEALLYVGSAQEPAATALVYDETDNTQVVSVVANEAIRYAAFGGLDGALLEGKHGYQATCLTPGVRIYCPNLDYRLVGFLVKGSVREGARSSFPG